MLSATGVHRLHGWTRSRATRTRTHQQIHQPQRCGRSRIDDWRHLRAVNCWFHGKTCRTQHSIPHVCTVFSDSQKCCSSLTSSTMYPTNRTAECPNTLKIYVLANRIIRLHQTIWLPTHVFLAIFQTERCSAKRDPMCFQIHLQSCAIVVAAAFQPSRGSPNAHQRRTVQRSTFGERSSLEQDLFLFVGISHYGPIDT